MKLSELQNKLSQSELYNPAEDTFFFAEYLEKEKGLMALDIGTGSGYLARILSSKFSFVVGTDINFGSLNSQNPKLQNLICCNGADALRCKFDLIVCNLPYLPSEKISDRTIDGGKEGLEIPLGIINSVCTRIKKGGKFVFLTSSLANYQKLLEKTKMLGFDVRIVARKKLFYEELFLVEAKNKNIKFAKSVDWI